MSSNHWPLYVDLSRDESKRILRRLELEAYGSVVSAFRAQGDLTKKKCDALQNLQRLLSISTERHRAEVRRATNDEELTTIAANISGLDVSSEWQVEGRRLIPLLPRLVPQTAFTLTANSAASMQAEKNASLPSPSKTASKETAPAAGPCPTPPSAGIGAAGPKMPRPASPNSNVVVLPSGMSIHIKGLTEDEESPVLKKRRRSSSSSESSILVSKAHPTVSTMTSSKVIASGLVASSGASSTPMKITFSKSPVKSQTTITPSQKVILVSSSQTATGANILQRSLNVPVVKATTAVSLATASSSLSNKPSIIVSTPTVTTASSASLGNIITVASSGSGVSTTGSSYVHGQSYVTSTFKPRTKTITTMRHRAPNTMGRGSRIIPVGGSSGPVHPSPQGMQNIHIKPVMKPTIHIKQEGGMKIITQGVPQSANKILPKPSAGGNSPVVVVTTVSTPGITMVTKSAQGSPMGSRVLNITTQGGKVIATTSRSTSGNVVTVNPKTLQLTAIKGATGAKVLASGGRVATATGTKPNVIVVQKAQPRGRGMSAGTPTVIKASTSSNNPFEKELVSFIQRQDSGKQLTQKITERKLIAPKPSLETLRKTGVIRQRSEPYEGNKSSLLAELIQAVGIIPQEGGGDNIQVQEATSGQEVTVQPGTSKGGHRWVEYDAPAPRTSLPSRTVATASRENSTAIKALLDLRPSVASKVKTAIAKSTPIEYGEQEIQQSEVYTIDSLGNLIPQSDKLVTSTEEIQFIQSNKPGGEEVLVSVEGSGDFAHQVTSLGGEILGELDPQTGIFYNTSTSQSSENVTSVGGAESTQQVVLSTAKTPKTVVVTTSSRQMDFLTSALSQANIDLDSYHFIEEDDSSASAAHLPGQGPKEVVIKTAKVQERPTGMPMMSLLTQQTVTSVEKPQESVILTQEESGLLTENVVLEENVIEMPIEEPLKEEELVIEQDQQHLQTEHPQAEPLQLQTVQKPVQIKQPQRLQVEQPQRLQVEQPQRLQVEQPQRLQVEQPQRLQVEQRLADNQQQLLTEPQVEVQAVQQLETGSSTDTLPDEQEAVLQPNVVPLNQTVDVTQVITDTLQNVQPVVAQESVVAEQPSIDSQAVTAPVQPAENIVSDATPVEKVVSEPVPVAHEQSSATAVSLPHIEQPKVSLEQPSSQDQTLVQPVPSAGQSLSLLQSDNVLLPQVGLVSEPVIIAEALQKEAVADAQLKSVSVLDNAPPLIPEDASGTTVVKKAADELSEITSTQDTATASMLPETEKPLAVSNLPLIGVPELPQIGVPEQLSSEKDTTIETVVSVTQPDTSSVDVQPAVKVVMTGNQLQPQDVGKMAAELQEAAVVNIDAPLLQSPTQDTETAVISSTQDDDGLPTITAGNVIVMETGVIDKSPGVVMETISSLPVHAEGSGVTVAYQPQAEIVSFTSQVEHMDSSGDHDVYEYEDALGSPSAGGSSEYYDDPSTPLRNSKRKRKPPRAADESPPPTPQIGWIKMAVSLLLKVSRFRGIKEKGEPNASIWFLEPVSAIDVPDYYDIIKKPMDFSKVKRKLENGEYRRWDDFNADMMLIRENCYIYNVPGSVVRSDCDQVFTFYASEYSKAVEKWQRAQLASPTKKFRPEKQGLL